MDYLAIAELLGNIGEFVGSIGVFASLIYVGFQIRQNTIATERANARHTSAEHTRALRSFMSEDFAGLGLRAMEDLGQLNPTELYQFGLAMSSWLETIEQAYADAELGHFSSDLLTEYRNRLSLVLETPGGREWWGRNSGWFSPTFRSVVQRVILEGMPPEMESGRISFS